MFTPQAVDRWVAARQQVASLLRRPMSEVVLRREPSGKPVLDLPRGFGCSFAHRLGITMVGVTESGTLGVDLELIRDDLDAGRIAREFFSGGEARWVADLQPGRRELGFTALWCAKEAVLKATGTGIADGMKRPVIDCARLTPLLCGAASVALSSEAGMLVELRACLLGKHMAMACVAFAASGTWAQARNREQGRWPAVYPIRCSW